MKLNQATIIIVIPEEATLEETAVTEAYKKGISEPSKPFDVFNTLPSVNLQKSNWNQP